MADSTSSLGSNVIRDGNRRKCHIASILPLSSQVGENQRRPVDFRICLEASAYLALTHVRNPSKIIAANEIPSSLSERLKQCDIDFSVSFYDTKFSNIEAARQLQNAINNRDKRPVALLGSARSSVSMTVATLAAAYQLPQISPSSTSDDLDDKGRAPFFSRTVPTNAGDAQAIILYLKQLGVTHFGVYYIRDAYGTAYHTHLANFANQYEIKAIPFSYDSAEDIPQIMANLAASDLRYFIGIFNPSTMRDVFRSAKEEGIIGKGYTWFLTEASLEVTDSAFELSQATDAALAQALHGTGIVTLNVPPSFRLRFALQELFSNETARETFFQLHNDPSLFDDWNASSLACGGSSVYPLLAYDAILSMAVAACETPNDLFTGPELYQQLLQTEVEGISGLVAFDPLTGTRQGEDLPYRLSNILISPTRSTESKILFDVVPASDIIVSSDAVKDLADFVYADNTTNIPSPYPDLEVEMNLMGGGVRAAGLSLGAVVMISSVYLLQWLVRNRTKEAVRASQPIFLCQILVGIIILVSALIPLSLQEPVSKRGLDIACMSVPWLVSIGFVMAFSALFAKLWRVNKLLGINRQVSQFARKTVLARDVAKPFFILLGLNLVILTTWTIINPLRWQRIPVNSVDSFGRVLETYGTCAYDSDSDIGTEIIFMILILGVNLTAVVCALYQAYLGRNIPAEFSEVSHIATSFALMFEVGILGVPIILLLDENPKSLFMAQSIILSFVGMSLLIPIIAKHRQHHIYRATDPDGQRQRNWHQRTLRRVTGFGIGGFFTGSSDRRNFSSGGTRRTFAIPNFGLGQPGSPRQSFEQSQQPDLSRGLSERKFGQTRIRRTRDFYEERAADTIRSEQRTEIVQSIKQRLKIPSIDLSLKSAKFGRDGSASSKGAAPSRDESSQHQKTTDMADGSCKQSAGVDSSGKLSNALDASEGSDVVQV